jgi:O-antigen/teichoic acid export membrane protein
VFFSGWILFSAVALQDFTADQYLIASALRWLALALMAAIIILPLVKKPSLRWMSETFRFGTYHFWMYLAGFFLFFSMDVLLLNHFLGAAAAGIYGAYYMTFNVIAGKFFNSIIEALYPMASTIDDAKTMLTRIVQLSKWLVLPIFISGIVLNAILFQFYGRDFPFQWDLAAFMSLIIVLYVISGLMASIIGSRGINGARFLLAAFALGAVANVGLKIIVIPEWELVGAMLVTVFIFALMLGAYWRWLRAEANKTSS